jgi:pimeloyl-ACP methyl ester carboxylesterase
VDSADKEQNQRFGTLFNEEDEDDARFRRRAIALMPLGVPRMLGWCNTLPYDLPRFKPKLAELTALSCRKSAFETFGYEWSGFGNEEKEVESLGSVPLVVLSHDPRRWSSPGYLQAQVIWDQMQVELTHLSSNSKRVVATGSGHDIHVESPELVTQAVHRVYDSALRHTPLEAP